MMMGDSNVGKMTGTTAVGVAVEMMIVVRGVE
jgi:hypothetical protein